jgi:hypothetical protein
MFSRPNLQFTKVNSKGGRYEAHFLYTFVTITSYGLPLDICLNLQRRTAYKDVANNEPFKN